MASAYNEAFTLKFELTAKVDGEGDDRSINIVLDKKIVPVGGGAEVVIQKEEGKTAEVLRNRLKQEKKGYINIKQRHMFLDTPAPADSEVKFLTMFKTENTAPFYNRFIRLDS
jgi:hypothetical protein